MGVDSRVIFPPETRLDDVATAIGILLGIEPVKDVFGSKEALDSDGSWATHIKVKPHIDVFSNIPSMVTIGFPDYGFYAFYHFEGNSRGERVLSVRYDEDRLPLLNALARFFGAKLTEADCEEEPDRAYDYPYPRLNNAPEGGTAWQEFEQELFDLREVAERIEESVRAGWPSD